MLPKFRRTLYVVVTLVFYVWLSITGRKLRAQEWLFDRLFELGGIYIKFLQLLAVREDSIQVKMSGLKNSLAVFDQVKYEKIDVISLLRAELGKKAVNIQVAGLSPFAAGSFAQVYSGYVDGREVIIKVLRPSVAQFLSFDLALLGSVARVVSLMQPKGIINFKGVYRDLKRVSLREIDYQNEVNNAVRLYNNLSSHPVIHIPKTYSNLSTSHVIVQEKISGLPLTNLLSDDIGDKTSYVQQTYGTSLEYVMEELMVELLKGSLTDEGTHGDPHPGNIYILPNNQIALIDFGVESVIHKNKPELIKLLVEYVALYKGEFDPNKFIKAMLCYVDPRLTQSIQTLSTYFGKENLVDQILDEVGREASQSLSKRSSDPTVSTMIGQYRMVVLFTEVINKNNRFGLRASIDSPEFLRSTQILLNLIHILGIDKQLIRRTYQRVIDSYEFSGQTQSPDYDIRSIDNSMHTVASWFERLQHSDPVLYSNIIKRWKGSVL